MNPTNYYDSYKLWNDTVAEALSEIQNDKNGFYRINCTNDYIGNSPLYFDYNGITSFSSFENYELRRTLENLGMILMFHTTFA